MSGRQHLLNDAIDEDALRGSDPDPVLVRTVEEATERPASGVGFGGGSSPSRRYRRGRPARKRSSAIPPWLRRPLP